MNLLPSLDLLLQHGSHYMNCAERDNEGRTFLLQYCNDPWTYIRPFGIDFLLSQGSSIRERDMNDDTCLHLVFRTHTVEYSDWKHYLFALVYLIYKGADATAVNAAGNTPSDLTCGSSVVRGNIPLNAWWRYILMKCKLFTRVNDEEKEEEEEEEEEDNKEEEEDNEEEEEGNEEEEEDDHFDFDDYTCRCCYLCMIGQYLHMERIQLGIFISALKTYGDLSRSVEAADEPDFTRRWEEATCIHHAESTLEDQALQGQGIGVVSTEMDDLALKFNDLSLAD